MFHLLLTFGFLIRYVTFISTGQSEFAEFMSNHVFSYENRHVCFAVMHGKCQPHEIREDCGAAGPGLDRTFVVLLKSGLYLLHQVMVDKRTFFQLTWHSSILSNYFEIRSASCK